MTTDPHPSALVVDTLPRDPTALRACILREHSDRAGQLGAAWWDILGDAYEGTGGFMRSVYAAATADGGRGNREGSQGRGRSTYLTPFRRESADAFTARADRSAYENHVAPVVDIYHGHLVRRRAERVSTLPTVTAWWTDVDGHGHDAGEWVAGVALRAQLYGWCAVLVDRPRDGARTTATALDPGELRDWQVGHDGRLEWARLVSEWCDRDPATGDEVRVIEASLWTRDEWARVRMESTPAGQWEEVARDGDVHSLGRVPLAILRWQEPLSARQLYGLSQVQGVLPLVLALFNLGSELDDHLAGCAFAMLTVETDDPASLADLKLGTNNGFPYRVGGAPPAFISPGADVSMQYALRIEQRLAAIYTAAKMEKPGASPAGGDPASGIAKAYDFTQTDAGLQTFARQLTRFEFELVALVAGWESSGDAAKVADAAAATTITYPQRFDAAGIAGDLGSQFAVLDDKIRAQLPPEMWRQARLALARGLNPEASPATEALFVEQIDAMYARDLSLMGAASPDPVVAAAADVAGALDALPLAAPDALTSAPL